MSADDTLSDSPGSVSSGSFVEISYDDLIPNNVGLSSDKQLQRALETWRPKYLGWWNDMGPVGYQQSEVYLRTAVGVDPAGWAKFGYVKMPAIAGASCLRRRSRDARFRSAATGVRPHGRRCLANTARCSAGLSWCRGIPNRPRSSSSAS